MTWCVILALSLFTSPFVHADKGFLSVTVGPVPWVNHVEPRFLKVTVDDLTDDIYEVTIALTRVLVGDSKYTFSLGVVDVDAVVDIRIAEQDPNLDQLDAPYFVLSESGLIQADHLSPATTQARRCFSDLCETVLIEYFVIEMTFTPLESPAPPPSLGPFCAGDGMSHTTVTLAPGTRVVQQVPLVASGLVAAVQLYVVNLIGNDNTLEVTLALDGTFDGSEVQSVSATLLPAPWAETATLRHVLLPAGMQFAVPDGANVFIAVTATGTSPFDIIVCGEQVGDDQLWVDTVAQPSAALSYNVVLQPFVTCEDRCGLSHPDPAGRADCAAGCAAACTLYDPAAECPLSACLAREALVANCNEDAAATGCADADTPLPQPSAEACTSAALTASLAAGNAIVTGPTLYGDASVMNVTCAHDLFLAEADGGHGSNVSTSFVCVSDGVWREVPAGHPAPICRVVCDGSLLAAAARGVNPLLTLVQAPSALVAKGEIALATCVGVPLNLTASFVCESDGSWGLFGDRPACTYEEFPTSAPTKKGKADATGLIIVIVVLSVLALLLLLLLIICLRRRQRKQHQEGRQQSKSAAAGDERLLGADAAPAKEKPRGQAGSKKSKASAKFGAVRWPGAPSDDAMEMAPLPLQPPVSDGAASPPLSVELAYNIIPSHMQLSDDDDEDDDDDKDHHNHPDPKVLSGDAGYFLPSGESSATPHVSNEGTYITTESSFAETPAIGLSHDHTTVRVKSTRVKKNPLYRVSDAPAVSVVDEGDDDDHLLITTKTSALEV